MLAIGSRGENNQVIGVLTGNVQCCMITKVDGAASDEDSTLISHL